MGKSKYSSRSTCLWTQFMLEMALQNHGEMSPFIKRAGKLAYIWSTFMPVDSTDSHCGFTDCCTISPCFKYFKFVWFYACFPILGHLSRAVVLKVWSQTIQINTNHWGLIRLVNSLLYTCWTRNSGSTQGPYFNRFPPPSGDSNARYLSTTGVQCSRVISSLLKPFRSGNASLLFDNVFV